MVITQHYTMLPSSGSCGTIHASCSTLLLDLLSKLEEALCVHEKGRWLLVGRRIIYIKKDKIEDTSEYFEFLRREERTLGQ